MPDSFKPIDMPESFKPIVDSGTIEPQPLLVRDQVNPSGEWIDTPSGKQWKSSTMSPGLERKDSSMFDLDSERLTSRIPEIALPNFIDVTKPTNLRKVATHGLNFLEGLFSSPESVLIPSLLKAGVKGAAAKELPELIRPGAIEVPKVNVEDLVDPRLASDSAKRQSSARELTRDNFVSKYGTHSDSEVIPDLADINPTGEPGYNVEPISYQKEVNNQINRNDHPFDKVITYRDSNGKMQGVLRMNLGDNGLPISEPVVWVDPSLRRQGIATQLYKTAEDAGYDFSKTSGAALTREGAELFHSRINKKQPLNPTAAKVDPLVPALPESTIKLRTAFAEAKPLNAKQKEIYRLERGEKAAKAEGVSVKSEDDLGKFYSALKGEHSKVDIEPLRNHLEQADVDDLIKQIHSSNQLGVFDKANATDGLRKLLAGKVPTESELSQMKKIFGEDFGGNIQQPMTLGRALIGLGTNTKGLKSAGDFGSPFRQARNYAYRQSWFKSLVPMIKSYGSKRIFDEEMSFIRNDPFFETARDKMKVAFTDLKDSNFNREESAVGKLIGNLPLVKNSNRASTIFANKIRFEEAKTQYNVWKTAYESGMKIAKTAEEKEAAKLLNPDSPYIAAKLGDKINTATGRGKLPGNTEKVAEELNALLFSPRLMSARIRSINRLMNPVMWAKYNPVERKDALKQVLSLAAMGMTEAMTMKGILNASGHNATIGTDADSTDFMKVIIDGKTRYDPWGGYQQYFVPIFKIASGTSKPAGEDAERRELGESPVAPSGMEVLERTLIDNKLSPLAAAGATMINRRELDGRPLNFTSINPMENTLTRALANPIILQDAYDILMSDPSLGPLLIPDMFGQGVSVYEDR